MSRRIHKIPDNIYTNSAIKALILVKRLRLRQVLVRLPYLLSTLPLHKQFYGAIILRSRAANLLHPPLLLPAVVANV